MKSATVITQSIGTGFSVMVYNSHWLKRGHTLITRRLHSSSI